MIDTYRDSLLHWVVVGVLVDLTLAQQKNKQCKHSKKGVICYFASKQISNYRYYVV